MLEMHQSAYRQRQLERESARKRKRCDEMVIYMHVCLCVSRAGMAEENIESRVRLDKIHAPLIPGLAAYGGRPTLVL